MRFILTNTASKPLESGCFLGVSSPAEVLKKKELKLERYFELDAQECPAEVLKKKELKRLRCDDAYLTSVQPKS